VSGLERRQAGLDGGALRLEPGREHQTLAQRLGSFVHSESGAFGGQLEQGPAGLGEVDRLEPESVDDSGRPAAGLRDLMSNPELRSLVGDAPGHVVHAPHTPGPAPHAGKLAQVDEPAGASVPEGETMPALLNAGVGESKRVGEEIG